MKEQNPKDRIRNVRVESHHVDWDGYRIWDWNSNR